MTNSARTAALAAALALGVWLSAAADSNSADEKPAKPGPYNTEVVDLAAGKGSAEAIAKKAELGEVMHAFKPRDKGGLGLGPTPGAIKPDAIELKLIDLGKMKKGLPKGDVAKQADAIAKAADVAKAIAEITDFYADKDGKKNPKKWKEFTDDMKKGAVELSKAAKKGDGEAIKKAANNLNKSCNDCHADFRD